MRLLWAGLKSATLCSLRGQGQPLDPAAGGGEVPPPLQREKPGQFSIGWSSHIGVLRVGTWEKEASHAFPEVAPNVV